MKSERSLVIIILGYEGMMMFILVILLNLVMYFFSKVL